MTALSLGAAPWIAAVVLLAWAAGCLAVGAWRDRRDRQRADLRACLWPTTGPGDDTSPNPGVYQIGDEG